MVHKDEEAKRAYMKTYMKNLRAKKVSIVQPIQITMNQPVFEAQEVPVAVSEASAQSGDLKDQIIANLLEQIENLKQENKRLRGDAESIFETRIVSQKTQTTSLAVVETVAVVTPEPRYTLLSEYLNVEILDSWNLNEFMTNMTIEDTDMFPIFKASMKRLNDKNEILMKDWCGINDVILSILKRELKKDAHTMPIRRTFFKNKYQHSVMSDRTWQNVEGSVFYDMILKFCQKICWRLSQLYRTVIKPKSVADTQYTMMYKTTHQFNTDHMPLWFQLEVDKGATQLYKHVVESVEALITITMN